MTVKFQENGLVAYIVDCQIFLKCPQETLQLHYDFCLVAFCHTIQKTCLILKYYIFKNKKSPLYSSNIISRKEKQSAIYKDEASYKHKAKKWGENSMLEDFQSVYFNLGIKILKCSLNIIPLEYNWLTPS